MVWGLSTGRSGTHLLAENLGGAHEPMPRIIKEASENDIYRIEQNVRPYYEQWLSRP
jgi:hypothetical protein